MRSLHYKPRKLIFRDRLWQITRNHICFDGDRYNEISRHKLAVLGMAGDHGDNQGCVLDSLKHVYDKTRPKLS